MEYSSMLLHHKQRHSASVSLCSTCGKTFKYYSDLKKHEPIHNLERKWVCCDCGKRFKTYPPLRKHVIRHTKDDKALRLVMCEHCSRCFYTKQALEKHIKCIHQSGKYKFVCHTCPKHYINKRHFKMHQKEYHSGPPGIEHRLHKCQQCGKGFRSKSEVRVHMVSHLKPIDRPFECHICGVRMSRKNHMMSHFKRVHKLSMSTEQFISVVCTPGT